MTPDAGMILAAGLGIRMRPLTENTAKPLLPLGGRALIDHALDRLAAAGVARAVVNAHWHADRVEAHLSRRVRPSVAVLRESVLLDTGAAVRAALDAGLLGPAPFYVVNGDSVWLDGPCPALDRLRDAFDPAETDAVLLLHRTFQARSEVGPGDFALDPLGTPRRRREREVVPYVYAGVQVATPALFADAPEGAFSMNPLWDRAMAAGRARGVVHDGLWFHLSRPADLADAESALHERLVGDTR